MKKRKKKDNQRRKWTMRDGRKIRLSDMDEQHLMNTDEHSISVVAVEVGTTVDTMRRI